MSCIFCKIAAGEIPSEKVFENEHAFAFLDINPLTKGHVLVVPKRHYARLAEMAARDAHALMDVAQEVLRRVGERLEAPGATVAVNEGPAAGQEVPHVHVHIVPRREGDSFGPVHALFTKRPELRAGELKDIGARLRG